MAGKHRLAPVGQPVAHRILTRGREEAAVHPLGLHAQHQHRVGGRQLGVQIVGHRHRPVGDPDRQQRGRRDQHHLGAEGGQQHDVGPGDPAVQDVADDDHPATLDVAEPLPQGQRVQQRLRRVLVSAVAGIDHRRSTVRGGRPVGEPLRGTGCRVADDQRIGAGGAQGQRGVAQRFTFAHRRSRSADVDHVGAHPLAGDLEGHPGAGGVLVEHRDDGAAPQRRQLADFATDQGLREAVGVVEDRDGLVAGQVAGGQQMPAHEPSSRAMTTASRPSCSASSTCTLSVRDVGTFLPT